MDADSVAEIQGLYGPVTVAETLLQKIWYRGDFNPNNLLTLEELPLVIHDRGIWNRQEGPDFKQAEIEIAGQRQVGDIEIHFYARDWFYHGHDRSPHFDNVILHITLFEPSAKERADFENQPKIRHQTLVFLPLLTQDIESYAMQEAFLAIERSVDLEQHDSWLVLTPDSRINRLREKALLRWRQKVTFARQRLEQADWNAVCHQACLEVLGFRRNRVPMLNLATRFPLAEMAKQRFKAQDYFNLERDNWKLSGLRPSNHPHHRIEQYLNLLAYRPNWPASLRRIQFGKTAETMCTATFRKQYHLTQQKQFIQAELLGNTLGGTRLDTFICDALLPLLSVATDTNLFPFWFHWFGGDVPDGLIAFEKAIEVIDSKTYPAGNGIHQGALQVFIEKG